MAWVQVQQHLQDHPKTKRLARRLGTSVPAVIGHLQLLWGWAMDYAQDGDLSRFDAEDIADAMMYEGDAEKLLDALTTCAPGGGHGFLERTEDGRLVIHDWMEYSGEEQ